MPSDSPILELPARIGDVVVAEPCQRRARPIRCRASVRLGGLEITDHPKNPRELAGTLLRWEWGTRQQSGMYEFSLPDEVLQGCVMSTATTEVRVIFTDTHPRRVAARVRERRLKRLWLQGKYNIEFRPEQSTLEAVFIDFVMPAALFSVFGFQAILMISGRGALNMLPLVLQVIAWACLAFYCIGSPAVFWFILYKVRRAKRGGEYVGLTLSLCGIHVDLKTGDATHREWREVVGIGEGFVGRRLLFRDNSSLPLPLDASVHGVLRWAKELDEWAPIEDEAADGENSNLLIRRIFFYFFIGAVLCTATLAWIMSQSLTPWSPMRLVGGFVFIAFGLPAAAWLSTQQETLARWLDHQWRGWRRRRAIARNLPDRRDRSR